METSLGRGPQVCFTLQETSISKDRVLIPNRVHEAERQYACPYCSLQFKNQNELERHQNSVHVQVYSWSCAALKNVKDVFSPDSAGFNTCGYCGGLFPEDSDAPAAHATNKHKFGECNQSKKFFRVDHFRQHLKHSHHAIIGPWMKLLENVCTLETPSAEQFGQDTYQGLSTIPESNQHWSITREEDLTSTGTSRLRLIDDTLRPAVTENDTLPREIFQNLQSRIANSLFPNVYKVSPLESSLLSFSRKLQAFEVDTPTDHDRRPLTLVRTFYLTTISERRKHMKVESEEWTSMIDQYLGQFARLLSNVIDEHGWSEAYPALIPKLKALETELLRNGTRDSKLALKLDEGTAQLQASSTRASYDWLLNKFWAEELDITVVGLHNAGKTSLSRVLAGEERIIEPIPTLGFNVKRVTGSNGSIKCWDLGGQSRFRSMWERYCRGVRAIVFMIDCSDRTSMPTAKEELHALLGKPNLGGIPLLVLGNKSDLLNHADIDEITKALNLDVLVDREVSCYTISTKDEVNIEAVLQWLIAHQEKNKVEVQESRVDMPVRFNDKMIELEAQYCPPLDAALLSAILMDHDLAVPEDLARVKRILDNLKEDAIFNETISLDPSSTSVEDLSAGIDQIADTSASRSQETKSMNSKSQLTATLQPPPAYRCGHYSCMEAFESDIELNRHTLKVHNPNNAQIAACRYPGCHQSFSTREAMVEHMHQDHKSSLPEQPLNTIRVEAFSLVDRQIDELPSRTEFDEAHAAPLSVNSSAAIPIPAPRDIPWLETGAKANSAYLNAREDALKHGALRNKFLQSAAQAWNRNDARAAKALSLRGQSENNLMREKFREAARALYEEQNSQDFGELYVDLHGLHPEEAVSYLSSCLKEHKGALRPVYAIIHAGHHSKNRKDKVGNATRVFLNEWKYAFREFSVPGSRDNVGCILGIDPRRFDETKAIPPAREAVAGTGDPGVDEDNDSSDSIELVSGNDEEPTPTTPLVRQDDNGITWIAFEYIRDRVKMEYTIRCDIESVSINRLSDDFKLANCVYPRAMQAYGDYEDHRLAHESSINVFGWALATLNPSLREKRGLVQRAMEHYRRSVLSQQHSQASLSENLCMFCKQNEEHDPSTEYGDLLACIVCAKHAHQQCARDEGALTADQDAKQWRCKDCVVKETLASDELSVPPIIHMQEPQEIPELAKRKHEFKMLKSESMLVLWNCSLCQSGPHWYIYECSICLTKVCRSCTATTWSMNRADPGCQPRGIERRDTSGEAADKCQLGPSASTNTWKTVALGGYIVEDKLVALLFNKCKAKSMKHLKEADFNIRVRQPR